MTIDATAGYARIPPILSFPDTTGFAETYGFGAASGRVWLEGQYRFEAVPGEIPGFLTALPEADLSFECAAVAVGDVVANSRRQEFDQNAARVGPCPWWHLTDSHLGS